MQATIIRSQFWIEQSPEPPLPVETPVVEWCSLLTSVSSQSITQQNIKIPIRRALPIGSYWDRDFKNSLIITPKHIDLGFITGESEQYIEIWSTFERPLTLMGLQAFNAQGLALTGAQAGAVLAPYGGHWNYQLHVSVNVDFEVDARFDWQFDAISTALKVTGSRIVLWHYRPLYPVGQHWEWSNAIIDTYSGEQRLCNAQYPVQRFTYQHGEESLSGGQALTRFAGNGRFPIALPHWIDAVEKVNASKGDTLVRCSEKTTPNGQIHFLAVQDFGRRSTQVELTAIGRTRIHQLKQFIWHLKGSLNTVWWVSFHNEIRLAATCSRNRLVIKPLGLGSYINGVELALTWRDGKEYVHATSDGMDNNGNEILLLNTVNTAAANVDDLVSGHVMVRMRATSDEQTMTYTKDQLTVSLNLTEVPHGSD